MCSSEFNQPDPGRRAKIGRRLALPGVLFGVALSIVSGSLPLLRAAGDTYWNQPRTGDRDAFIRDALQIRLTPAGIGFVSQNLESILRANHFDIRRQSLESFQIALDSPIRLDDIPVGLEGERTTLADLAESLKKWLRGDALRNPMPRFAFETVGYEILDAPDASLRARFSLKPNPQATRLYRGDDPSVSGAVFDVDAVIPRLKLSARTLRVTDPANRFLGEWVVSSPELRIPSSGSTPLLIRLQVAITGTPAGLIHVEILSTQSNIAGLPVSLGFASLTAPTVQVTLNGHPAPSLDGRILSKSIADALRPQLPALARVVRERASVGLAGGFRDLFSAKVNSWILATKLGEASLDIPSPCRLEDCGIREKKLRIGVARAALGSESDLMVRLFADWNGGSPSIEGGIQAVLASTEAEDENLLQIDMSPADSRTEVVAALDARIYNKMLRDAWAAGWRPDIQQYRFVSAPQVKVVENQYERRAFLSVPLLLKPDGFAERQLFGACGWSDGVDDPYRVDAAVNLEARVSQDKESAIDLLRTGLDVDHTFVNPSQFSSCALGAVFIAYSDEERKKFLTSLVRSRIEEVSADLASHPDWLAAGLALPGNLLGLKLEVREAEIRGGRVLLHLHIAGVAE